MLSAAPPAFSPKVILARRNGRQWSVGAAVSAYDGPLIEHDPAMAEREANTLVGDAVAGVDDLLLKLELAAAAFTFDRATLAFARQLAASVRDSREDTLAFRVPPGMDVDAAMNAARATLARGGPGKGDRTGNTRVYLTHLAAALAAPLSVALAVLRHGGSAPQALEPAEDGVIGFALHGELTNRTKPLSKALRDAPGRPASPLILLGRPRQSVGRALDQLQLGEHIAGVRPLDLRAAARGMLASIASVHSQAHAVSQAPIQLTAREHFAIAARLAQGRAHAAWWRRVPHAARYAATLFGHTGTADTSGLERAMQRAGTRTVHCVHGANPGWPFAGVSDIGLFVSEADAQLGASLPAYRRCLSLPAPRPVPRDGQGRWALLTAYTHPDNHAYRTSGADADIAAVHATAEAARLNGVAPENVLWRPHPMLASVDASQRTKLEVAVDEGGFERWPKDLPLEMLAEASLVLTTPSTVLVDTLRMGKTPILLATSALQQDSAYARYPWLADDAASLAEIARKVLATPCNHAMFERAWTSIGPGAALDLPGLIALARDPETAGR